MSGTSSRMITSGFRVLGNRETYGDEVMGWTHRGRAVDHNSTGIFAQVATLIPTSPDKG